MPNSRKSTSTENRLYPKKTLGQNFLINPHIRNKIVAACRLSKEDIILEIGPGKGYLTEILLPQVKKLIAVEKDHRLAQHLTEEFADQDNIQIENADILQYNIPTDSKIIVIGNIPYNISTPIIEKLILQRHKINKFYLTVQLEFGERLSAEPNSKKFGALSCFAQFYADVTMLFKIKNTAFHPKPKVESCFVQMDFLESPRYKLENEDQFLKFIKQAFTRRRKTLVNALSISTPKELILSTLARHQINPKLRPENLSLNDFYTIYNELRQGEGTINHSSP